MQSNAFITEQWARITSDVVIEFGEVWQMLNH